MDGRYELPNRTVTPKFVPLGLKRLFWFVLLWTGGVATIAAIGLAIRWAIMP